MAGLAIVMTVLFFIAVVGCIYLGVRLSRALEEIKDRDTKLVESDKEFEKYRAECFCHDIIK